MYARFLETSYLLSRWPWLAGTALFCIVFSVSLVERSTQRTLAAQADGQLTALTKREHLRVPSLQSAAPAPNIIGRLEQPERLSAVAQDLKVLALQHGLVLLDAHYKPRDIVDAQMGRVDLSVRMTGSYVPFKKTLAALLEAHHSLALESLTLRRSASTDAVLEVDLKFIFYYRKQA